MLFLINIVDYFWILDAREHIGDRRWIWLILIPIVSSARIFGTLVIRKRVSAREWTIHSLSRVWAGAMVLTATIVAGLSFAAELSIHELWLVVVCVLCVVVTHGVVSAGSDVLVNELLPSEYSSSRATLLSIGTALRSVLAFLLVFAPRGRLEHPSILWLIPSLLVLLTSGVAYRGLRRPRHALAATPL
jgi:hypothetical protein